jgi:transcriptional regulator with XRE-family HTH domain
MECIYTFMKRAPARHGVRPRPQYANLADYIAKTGDTQAHIAARVGTSQACISRILTRGAVPRSLVAMRIAEYANIPLDSFTRYHLIKRGEVA